jgi:multidrug efflux pump subunit AcrA (membrane-fusion protein)
MPSSHHKRYGIVAGIVGAAALGCAGWSAATHAQNVPVVATASAESVLETGITMPLKEWKPVFKYQGVIKSVPVKEGELVKAGALLLDQ